MVKLKGPIQSLQASGAIASTLIFSQTKGRSYLKKLTKPKQPRSAIQIANRAFLEFLTKAWTYVGSTDKASWQTDADRLSLDPYRAFIQHNLQQLTTGQIPTVNKSIDTIGPVGGTSNRTADPRNRTINISFDKSYGAFAWILQLTRGTSAGFTPSPANTIHCFDISLGAHWEWVDRPLPPGHYYYKHRMIQLYNQMHAWFAFDDCIL